jgi:GNAT superfamily N-acetyltransferase
MSSVDGTDRKDALAAQDVRPITLRTSADFREEQLTALYRAVGWSAARKPAALFAALRAAHSVVAAWDGDALIGVGYAISDGHLVVHYPHLVVAPAYQGRGVGSSIMRLLMSRYAHLHQQSLLADSASVAFYARFGFRRAGRTEPMWIYDGTEH